MFGRSKRRASWTQVATELGGEHHLPSKWWRGDEHITAVVHGVSVKLDTYTVSTGNSSQVYTRIAARFALGPGVKSQAYREGFFSALGKLVGMQDAKLGDADFDAAFIVKGDNIAVVRRLWTASTMSLMHAVERGRVGTDTDGVKLVGSGRWSDPVQMRTAMLLVGELAARDLYGVDALHALNASVTQPPGERPRAELDTGARVVVMAEDRDDRLVMSARVYDPLAHDPLELEVVDGRTDRATLLPQAAQAHLTRVGSGTLSIGNVSAFIWRDLELDPERLRAGAALLGAISVRDGVYR